jgi:chromosome segregation protein
MYVRRLLLQGFKTFAPKTSFEFKKGITAVVGPNGSGKSNLADALRWVLGEQSYSTLRGRRTEDVIFSGSSSRSPTGMAEVSLLLDNEDHYFQIDFPELEITRRAYRSGVNEYFINRRRVRLQDVEGVLGGLTSSYVVIHQGMVDEALSLRPRERRILLEEAAEVRRYHERRQKSQERLRQTAANMTRVSDLRNELAPRLRLLERQSQQARQRTELQESLLQALRSWYRLLWEEASSALDRARQEEVGVQVRLTAAQAELEEANREVTVLRQTLQEAQRRQEEHRQQETELRRRETAFRQELAQVEGERRALQRYQQELGPEIERWRQEAARQGERQRLTDEGRLALESRLGQAQTDVQSREASLRQAEATLQSVQESRQEVQQRLRGIAARTQENERRLESLATRRAALDREVAERQGLLDELQVQQGQVQTDRAAAEGRQSEQEQDWRELLARAERLRAEVAQAQESHRRTIAALEQARLWLAENRARLEALSRSGAPSDGASYLQEWARREGRPILVPALAGLVIPPGLEAAVEAALGPHAAALLAANWEEAIRAVEVLTGAGAGRATLLPQDAVRLPEPPQAADPDSEGFLLDTVSFPEEARPFLLCLLGRVLLASDRETARRIAARLAPGWTVVTRQGEALSAEGFLRGGRAPDGQGALALERERQSLVRAVAEAEDSCREAEQAQANAQRQRATLEQALAGLNRQREEQRLLREGLARRIEEWGRELARLEGEMDRHRQRLATLQEEQQQIERERLALQDQLAELYREQNPLQEQVGQSAQSEQGAQEEYAHARDLWQEARTLWAVAQKEQENQRALDEMAHRNAERLQQQIADGEQRLREALGQMTRWEERGTILQAQVAQVVGEVALVMEGAGPAPIPLAELARWEDEAARRRQALLESEAAAARAAVEAQRQEDRLREVLRRGLAELGPEADAYGPAGEAFVQALLEEPPEWARTPMEKALPGEEWERRIAHLHEEIRRVGPVNPLAEEEYREARERYDFLKQQLQDLTEASRSLQQVIAELDQAMEKRFQETFEAINREFQGYFAHLFGGGAASLRLVRMEEEDEGLAGMGVEIIVRPPGKRAHSLALLSGGERALTSAALLFAILKVNPRPFCLLDEVDAMLDEANVGRFRECLEELSAQTQFIVITHNRGTVQAANTLYGVSMADDGTSRVLSLRLEETA